MNQHISESVPDFRERAERMIDMVHSMSREAAIGWATAELALVHNSGVLVGIDRLGERWTASIERNVPSAKAEGRS